jgi:hypothetical protein
MKIIPHEKPGEKYFCIPFPPPDDFINTIQDKKKVTFMDPKTKAHYSAIMEDMIWYPMNMISEFHAKVCLQRSANELRAYMIKRYKLKGNDSVAIVQFAMCD